MKYFDLQKGKVFLVCMFHTWVTKCLKLGKTVYLLSGCFPYGVLHSCVRNVKNCLLSWAQILCLWSFHCFTVRYESLPQKRINMFWDTVIFWEWKDLNKIQSHWILLRSYGHKLSWLLLSCVQEDLRSAPFAGFCIFHLLSEVDVIKTRTWQIICFSTKKTQNPTLIFIAILPHLLLRRTSNKTLVLFFLN